MLYCFAINRHRSSHIVWAISYKPVWFKLNAYTAFGLHYWNICINIGLFSYVRKLHVMLCYIYERNSTWRYSQRLLTRQKCNAMAIYDGIMVEYTSVSSLYIYVLRSVSLLLLAPFASSFMVCPIHGSIAFYFMTGRYIVVTGCMFMPGIQRLKIFIILTPKVFALPKFYKYFVNVMFFGSYSP